MNRPSKKDIKAAVERLKNKPAEANAPSETQVGKPADKKSSMRIRKKGI